MHIAAALKKKYVCISNGNTYKKFVPYHKEIFSECTTIFPPRIEKILSDGKENQVIKKYKYYSNLDINQISVERVIEAINELLKECNA